MAFLFILMLEVFSLFSSIYIYLLIREVYFKQEARLVSKLLQNI